MAKGLVAFAPPMFVEQDGWFRCSARRHIWQPDQGDCPARGTRHDALDSPALRTVPMIVPDEGTDRDGDEHAEEHEERARLGPDGRVHVFLPCVSVAGDGPEDGRDIEESPTLSTHNGHAGVGSECSGSTGASCTHE